MEYTILGIPRFDPTYTGNLLAWRRSLESRFVFNPNLGEDPADIAAVDREIAVARSQMEQELLKGAAQLQRIKAETMARRNSLLGALKHTSKTLAQAETNVRALNPFNSV